jgi:hypothetical protein
MALAARKGQPLVASMGLGGGESQGESHYGAIQGLAGKARIGVRFHFFIFVQRYQKAVRGLGQI